MSEDGKPRLAVLVDGALLEDDEAREMWTAFSAHMDEHRGDMAGFAKAQGVFEVRPEYRKGQAVLVVSSTEEEAKKAAAPPPRPKAPSAPKAKAPNAAKPKASNAPQAKAPAKKVGAGANGGKGKPPGKAR